MSAVKGVNATKEAAGFIGSNILDQGMAGGFVKAIVDTYEASALADASTITMGTKLPVGATILDVIFQWDDMGSTVTFKAGDAGDDDRYMVAGTDVTTANGKASISNIAGRNYVITGTSDTQIIVTTAGIWTGTLNMTVLYAL
jgi:hypothetical protein